MQDPFDGGFEPRELALQLVDIVTLRPEIQLCYIGIAGKCFEILEASRGTSSHSGSHAHGAHQHHHNNNIAGNMSAANVEEDDDDDEHSDGDTEDENDDGDDAGGGNTTADAGTDDEDGDDSSDDSGDGDSDTESMFQEPDQGQSHLRLREILFYDDKVAIFKARHARL